MAEVACVGNAAAAPVAWPSRDLFHGSQTRGRLSLSQQWPFMATASLACVSVGLSQVQCCVTFISVGLSDPLELLHGFEKPSWECADGDTPTPRSGLKVLRGGKWTPGSLEHL